MSYNRLTYSVYLDILYLKIDTNINMKKNKY